MKWGLCQEILELHGKLIARRVIWPSGMHLYLKEIDSEKVHAIHLSKKIIETESVEDIAEIIKRDLDLKEDENIDWVIV